jgi:hypothetical protein
MSQTCGPKKFSPNTANESPSATVTPSESAWHVDIAARNTPRWRFQESAECRRASSPLAGERLLFRAQIGKLAACPTSDGLPTTPTMKATTPMKKTNAKMTKIGSKEGKGKNSPSQLIDARIEELSDWRGEMLARLQLLRVTPAKPPCTQPPRLHRPVKKPAWKTRCVSEGRACDGGYQP